MVKKAYLKLPEERKKEIKEKGMDLYIEHEFDDVTIRMIVDKLEINMATFYRYFDEKEDLAINIYQDISSRFLKSDINIFRSKLDTKNFSEKEIAFMKKVDGWPDNVYRRLVFEVEVENVLPIIKASLQKERLNGNLRNNVVEDFAAYMYVTAEYNFWCYCKRNQIADEETLSKLSSYMDKSLFMEGIMLPDSEK